CGNRSAVNYRAGFELPHHIVLTWESSPHNSQSVTWRTGDDHKESCLEFCKATASPFLDATRMTTIKSVGVPDNAGDGLWYHHSATMIGLQASTRYSYRVGTEGNWSEWSEFQTSSGGNEPFSFLYFGDVQRDIHSLGSRILRQGIRNRPDAKFLLF